MTLDAVVPGFADAAVVFTAEHLLRGGDPVSWPSGQDISRRVTVRRAGVRFSGDGWDPAAFPAGEVVVFAPGSPYARCMTDGKPVAFTQPETPTLK